jgi:chromosomal replication initiation ATPase DnaA
MSHPAAAEGAPTLQLTLPLVLPVSWRDEDFLISDANRAAVAWIDQWPHWPVPALVLTGPAGCGKSHLAHRFAARSGAALVDAKMLAAVDPLQLAASTPAVVVEDADQAADGHAVSLLHLVNAAKEAGASLLLTAKAPPAAWALPLADLRSRLRAMATVEIVAPDDALLAAVMVKLFADRQLRTDESVIAYLLPRIERSFAAAKAVVAALDAASLQRGRPVTVALARAALARAALDGAAVEGAGGR